MAVPKRRTSRMRRNQRRANHDKVSAPTLVVVDYKGQEVEIPRRLAKSLDHLTPRQLKNLGVDTGEGETESGDDAD